MRLSDIHGDEVFDVLADAIGPICAIASDDSLGDLFTGDKPEDMSAKDYALQKVKNHMPALLRSHKDDLIELLAAINRQTVAEYRDGLSIGSLVKDVYELVTDEDIVSFLA